MNNSIITKYIPAEDLLRNAYLNNITIPININIIASALGYKCFVAYFNDFNKHSEVNFVDKTIYVSKLLSPYKQRFFLACEIAKIIFKNYPNINNNIIEHYAAELLIPKDFVYKEYKKYRFPLSSEIGKTFLVSQLSMKTRLCELGLVHYD